MAGVAQPNVDRHLDRRRAIASFSQNFQRGCDATWGEEARCDHGRFQVEDGCRDPGAHDWLDTAGHHYGIMGVRWVRAESHPEPKCWVVKYADLG